MCCMYMYLYTVDLTVLYTALADDQSCVSTSDRPVWVYFIMQMCMA